MKRSIPIPQLKRQAKVLQRQEGLRRFEALDRIAGAQGFRSWSHLSQASGEANPAAGIYSQLAPGEMIVIAARPGQGKTLFALALALEAMKAGRHAAFFTLEYTLEETLGRLATIDNETVLWKDAFHFDGSDEICADHIISVLGALRGPFVIIDYLQLLDQKRSNPPLTDQIATLSAFARRSGATIACISQIDRRFAATDRAMPTIADLRMPNPFDLSLFGRMCFLHEGRVESFIPPSR